MAHNTYTVLDEVKFESNWKIGITDTDPTTVKFYYKDPAKVTTILEFGVDDELVKVSTGNYRVDLILASEGMWNIRWEGVGGAPASKEDIVEALQSSFLP